MYFSEQGNVDDEATFITKFLVSFNLQSCCLMQSAVCGLRSAVCTRWSFLRCMTFADCRSQTADCRPQTADCGPQTADCRPQTADCRLQTGVHFWGKNLAVLFICGNVFLRIAEKKPKSQTLETAKILCHTVVYQIFLAMGLRSRTWATIAWV